MRCGGGEYSPGAAQEQCSRARFRVFKTIHMHNMELEALPLLQTVENLKVINLVRDPRDTYMSAVGMGMVSSAVKSQSADYNGLGLLRPSWHVYSGEDPGPLYIRYMCEMMQEQAKIESLGVLHLRYEDLTSDYGNAAGKVYRFLGTPASRMLRVTANEILSGEASGPSSGVSSFSWTCAERAAFESEECAAALASWGYDVVQPWSGTAMAGECEGSRAVWRDAAIKVQRLWARFVGLF